MELSIFMVFEMGVGLKVDLCVGGRGSSFERQADWGCEPLSLFASALATGAGRLFYKELKFCF